MRGPIGFWVALLGSAASLAWPACSREEAKPAPAPEVVELALIMPAAKPDDPCEDAAKLEALVEAADGGAYIGCGPLPRYAIREVIEQNQARFLGCLEQTALPKVERRFVVHWTVTPEGAVRDASVTRGPEGEEGLKRCLIAEAGKLVFPAPLGGGQVEIDWPFHFAPRPKAR